MNHSLTVSAYSSYGDPVLVTDCDTCDWEMEHAHITLADLVRLEQEHQRSVRE